MACLKDAEVLCALKMAGAPPPPPPRPPPAPPPDTLGLQLCPISLTWVSGGFVSPPSMKALGPVPMQGTRRKTVGPKQWPLRVLCDVGLDRPPCGSGLNHRTRRTNALPPGPSGRGGEKDIWWTARTARGGTGHLGRTATQRGRLWTACGQRCVDSKNSQTTPATTSASSIRQLLGAADTQTAHHATSSTAPTHQLLGSANAEMTPARAPAAAADRKQRPDATCEGKNG